MKALNDKLMLTDILAHLRDLMKQCGMAITHGACKNMRKMVTTANERTTQNQYEVFEYMNQNNMYPVKYASDAELQEAITMHKGKGA